MLGNYLRALGRLNTTSGVAFIAYPRASSKPAEATVGPGTRRLASSAAQGDLHRHIGGCLGLDDQRTVGRAVWDTLTLPSAGVLSTMSQRCSNKPSALRLAEAMGDIDIPRPHWTTALLVHADTDRLIANLFDVTEPRVALKSRHPLGFAAYERPGELSGSAILSHPAAIDPTPLALFVRHRPRVWPMSSCAGVRTNTATDCCSWSGWPPPCKPPRQAYRTVLAPCSGSYSSPTGANTRSSPT